MGIKDRLIMLVRRLRHPSAKAPVDVQNGERLDAVEQRLISVEAARRARRVVEGR